ncbi:histone acetyltransferase HAC12 isoform X2 [Ziziphus jujuba]|nr:histone acetyltransferase HAC12 isoform X2 [Ziziphus jujuba]XP_048327954.2 histone acetyltransferase HAC12 isoform X2 [Ziziphus jujuba]XP_048327956.2 histone acetyltransferase HAC12 isoform X2 [Ziziphus jujuba]
MMDVEGCMSRHAFGQITNYNLLNPPSLFQHGENRLDHQSVKFQGCGLMDWRKDNPRVSFSRYLMKNKIADILSLKTYCGGALWVSDFVTVLENRLFAEASSQEEYMNPDTLLYRLLILLQPKVDDPDCATFSQLEIRKAFNDIFLYPHKNSSISMYSEGNQFSGDEATNGAYLFPRENFNNNTSFSCPVQKQHNAAGVFRGYLEDIYLDAQSVFPSTSGEESVVSCPSLSIPKEHSTAHNNECQVDDCISGPDNQFDATDKLQPNMKHANTFLKGFCFGDYDGFSSENVQPCAKRSKMDNSIYPIHNDEISHLSDPLMVQSPLSVNSEVIQKVNQESVATSSMELTNSPEDTGLTDLTNSSKTGDKAEVTSDNMKLNSALVFPKEPSVDCDEKEAQNRNDVFQTEPVLEAKSTNPGNRKIKGVSITEFFTADQIKEHISSLRVGQGNLKKEIGNSENICQLCALDKLFLAPATMYCSCCGACIKKNKRYYHAPGENGTHYCFCTSCYKWSRGGNISFRGMCFSKAKLFKMKNDEETEESWVQCDKCEGWQHQICALFNEKSDLEGQAEYLCPKCCLQRIESGDSLPQSNYAFSAKSLPKTMLSNHIEQRLLRQLKQEREERAKVTGKSFDEVPGAEGLVVRVVLSVEKKLEVKKKLLNIFEDGNYPAQFPYRSKVILLFQEIEGVDVCVFGMYVQEFGSDCSHPNQRCVYIPYLDSVKYLRPEIKAVSGEPLRTFVYHEILIGYLDFVKRQGFATCFIWASPPSKGEDYIFYCHPQVQRTPKSDKLRQWYKSMLRKAANEKIVVNSTNLYDNFFVPSGQPNSKITAARLPYFDGDYWSGAVEDVLRNIEQEIRNDSQVNIKKLVKNRTLKAMGFTNPSDSNTKDILLMQKMGQNIFPVREDFMVICLQFVCTNCHELILSGQRWSCSRCKNFQLCERCHNDEQCLYSRNTHTFINGKQHSLSPVKTDTMPYDTKDEDIILDNDFFEDRHTFLNFCEKNHYQFDTLRQAKHSSMMVLHHLHNLTVSTLRMTCSICLKKAAVDPSWICELCPEFDVCAACYQEKGDSCHTHKLSRHSSIVSHWVKRKEARRNAWRVRELLDVIQHASQCHVDKACSYPNCPKTKNLFHHGAKCTVRVAGGCGHCKKVWLCLCLHSKRCGEPVCRVPRCMDMRRHAKMRVLQSATCQRADDLHY